jgi:hypothetical protein
VDRPAGCKSYLANSLFVFGEFGGNDYNAMIFGGYTTEQARKYTPKIVNTISRGIDVRELSRRTMASHLQIRVLGRYC